MHDKCPVFKKGPNGKPLIIIVDVKAFNESLNELSVKLSNDLSDVCGDYLVDSVWFRKHLNSWVHKELLGECKDESVMSKT